MNEIDFGVCSKAHLTSHHYMYVCADGKREPPAYVNMQALFALCALSLYNINIYPNSIVWIIALHFKCTKSRVNIEYVFFALFHL